MLQKFIEEFGEDLLDRICATIVGDSSYEDISFEQEYSDIHGLNTSGTATVSYPDKELTVEYANGNIAGFEIRDYYLE